MSDFKDSDELRLRIRQLERSVAALTKERDDLAKDVEQLCLSRGGHMFSSSYVASERIKFLEAELKSERQALRAMTLAQDSLQDDMAQMRAAKKQSDEGWQKEQRRATALQQDLQFFKAASSSAISERDAAAFEAASTKADLDAANSTLQDTQVQLALAQQMTQDLQAQLQSVQQQLQTERQDASECRVLLKQQKQGYEQHLQAQQQQHEQQLQALQQQLQALQQQQERELQVMQGKLQQRDQMLEEVQAEFKASQSEAAQFKVQVTELSATAANLTHQLSAAAAAAAAAKTQATQLKTANASLHKQVHTYTVEVRDLQTLLEQTSAALVASQARLHETHSGPMQLQHSCSSSSTAELHKEIHDLKVQLAAADAELQQAARDKLQVQLELSQAQAEEDEYAFTLSQLQQLYCHCKELLATATQQKVEALLQVAQQEAQQLQAKPLSTQMPTGLPQAQQDVQQEAQQLQAKPSSTQTSTGLQSAKQVAQQEAQQLQAKPQDTHDPQITPEGAATPRHQHSACDIEPHVATPPGNSSRGSSTACKGGQQQQQEQSGAAATNASSDNSLQSHNNLSDQQQAQQQQQQVVRGLCQLLLLTHRYVTQLQQLSPADIAAAAQAGVSSSSSSSSKGKPSSRWGPFSSNSNRAAGIAEGGTTSDSGTKSAAGTTVDTLALLAAAADGIERDKQQLLTKGHLKQQQLDALVTALVGRANGQPPSAAAAAAAAAAAVLGPKQQAGSYSGDGGVQQDSSTRNEADQLPVASAVHMAGSLPMHAAAAGSESLDVTSLQLALTHEVQQLAEAGVKALKYIPKVTALNSLMQGSW